MDLKAELQNFKAINLEEITQGEGQVPDNIRNSIFLYNKAIESLKSGSEDIAMIELKKATAMNPRFYEAMNLLGICYSYLGDIDKAAEIFEKVTKAESNSIVAMKYLQRMGVGESVQSQKNKPAKKLTEQTGEPLKRIRTSQTEAFPNSKMNSKISGKREALHNIVKIGAGVVVGFLLALMIYVSLPEKASEPPVADQKTTDTTDSAALAESEANYKELANKYELLQKDKERAIQQSDYYKATIKLYDIETLANDRKYENAADILLLMKTVEFKDVEKDKFNTLYQSIMPLAAKMAYDEGYKLYNARKYQDSLKQLEKVEVYYPEFKRMDAVLYYMGRCCQVLKDSRSAAALFQKLIDTYPNSGFTKSAKVRLKEITKIP